jgi:hypothetical protein
VPSKLSSVKVAAAALVAVLAVGAVAGAPCSSAAVAGLLGDGGSW